MSKICGALPQAILLVFLLAGTCLATPDTLRVENRVNPAGLDDTHPRLSWDMGDAHQGARQTAWEIQVARSEDDLANGSPLVWDSGWKEGDQSHLVPYDGPALEASTTYYWRVRVKNESQTASSWSAPAHWTTGLMQAAWTTPWIGYDAPSSLTPAGPDPFGINKAQWIYHPTAPMNQGTVTFYRKEFQVPADAARVFVGMEANFAAQFFLNGVELFQGGRFDEVPSYLDVTPWIRTGANVLSFRVLLADERNHAGLIASIRIERKDGTVEKIVTDGSWESATGAADLWSSSKGLETNWLPARTLGKPGEPNLTGTGQSKLWTPVFDSRVFSPPAVYLRTEIDLKKPVRSAIFHGTAQGLYDLYVNGGRLTASGFQPGWTQFDRRISYVSTDVTQALRPGRNALGAVLADGWFRGNLIWKGRERFGKLTRFSGRLAVEYTDGSRETFLTDGSWKASFGPVLQSDLMQGEIYDARLEHAGWSEPGFDDKAWVAPNVTPGQETYSFEVKADPTEPVQPHEEFAPKAVTMPKPGVYVVDFGQNFAGWVRLKISGQRGQSVYMRFGEELRTDGTLYTDNLRGINPADRYVCKGGGVEIWEPRFTYHGFRYVQITGLRTPPAAGTVTGISAYSGGPVTSHFESSSPLLNQLYSNITWSQRSNYFETLTDCPQRDERLGWVGDAHFFLRSATYNQNDASLLTKWFLDCLDTQGPDGNIRDGAPAYSPGVGGAHLDWAAALMITPWIIWNRYGDTQPIERHYDALKRYMGLWERFASDIDTGKTRKDHGVADYFVGDWCGLQGGTPVSLIGRVLGCVLSRQMADFSRITGHNEDGAHFTNLADHFRQEIIDREISPDGKVSGDTQTGYALVSRFGLYSPAQRDGLAQHFSERLKNDNYAILTGFHGTGHLLPGLTALGLNDDAAKIILSTRYPGWGFEIQQGATTIWEHWDGKKGPGEFLSPFMNSFNHYTFGSCGEWMMGFLAGLRPEAPGFKVTRIEPAFIKELSFADGSFDTPYGRVSNHWERKGGDMTMTAVIPANTTAVIRLPAAAAQGSVSGTGITRQPETDPQFVTFAAAPGTYVFRWREQAK